MAYGISIFQPRVQTCVPCIPARHCNCWTTKEVPKGFLRVQLWRTGSGRLMYSHSCLEPHKGQGWWDKAHVFAKHWEDVSCWTLPGFQAGSLTHLVCLSQTSWFGSFLLQAHLWIWGTALNACSSVSWWFISFREASFLGPAKRKWTTCLICYLGQVLSCYKLVSKHTPSTQWFCFLGKQLLWTSQFLTHSRAIANQSSAIIAILV